ncbi:unnamed protein product [Orchesella dallaii]|uniref:Uncharacterized protein n=1 Tax=Orchesella dallaii TaxID=48710 RepID=A0ABP1S904_9HEXA
MGLNLIFWLLSLQLWGLSAFLDRNTLNLNKELLIFEECSIHLVVTEIHDKKISSNDEIQIEPIPIPIVRSTYIYKHTQGGKSGIQCGRKKNLFLAPNQGFKFPASPPPNILCDVQIYVVPFECKSWNIEPGGRWDILVPRSHVDFHIDSALKNQAGEFFRVGRYFILVSGSTSPSKTKSMINNIFFLVDTECETCPEPFWYTPKVHFMTKLYFEAKCSRSCCEIVSTSIASHPIQRSTGRYSLQQYFSKVYRYPQEIENFEQYPKSNSWEVDCLKCAQYLQIASSMPKIDGNQMPLREWKEWIPVEIILLQILSPNSTIIDPMEIEPYLYVNPLSPRLPHPMLFTGHGEGGIKKQVMELNQDYHFVTCAGREQNKILSIIFLISAFDLPIWFFILISCITSGIALLLILKHRRDKHAELNPVATFLFAFDLLLDHHNRVMTKCRPICGTWLLVVIVLICGYEGLTTRTLTMPKPLKTWTFIEEIVNKGFKLYSQYEYVEKYSPVIENAVDNRLFLMINKTLVRAKNNLEAMKMEKLAYFFNIIGKCDEVAFLGELQSALETHKELEMKTKTVVKHQQRLILSKPFARVSKPWFFYNIPWPVDVYSKRIHTLIHSGIADLWNLWKIRVLKWRFRNDRMSKVNVKVLTLQDSIAVVFCLYGIMLGISGVGFIIEMRSMLWAQIIWVTFTLKIFVKRLRKEIVESRGKGLWFSIKLKFKSHSQATESC